jgi:hypothetical protein
MDEGQKMTRSEHLQWAKDRALREIDKADMWASFMSDMSKHEELKDHVALPLGMMMLIGPRPQNRNDFVRFIEGFN